MVRCGLPLAIAFPSYVAIVGPLRLGPILQMGQLTTPSIGLTSNTPSYPLQNVVTALSVQHFNELTGFSLRGRTPMWVCVPTSFEQ